MLSRRAPDVRSSLNVVAAAPGSYKCTIKTISVLFDPAVHIPVNRCLSDYTELDQ